MLIWQRTANHLLRGLPATRVAMPVTRAVAAAVGVVVEAAAVTTVARRAAISGGPLGSKLPLAQLRFAIHSLVVLHLPMELISL